MKVQTVAAIAAMLVTSQALSQPQKAKPDWIVTTNQPCKVWNPEPQPNESVTWSGECKDGFATGKGILRWSESGKPEVVFDGEYRNGKRNGHGVLMTPDGDHVEGVWVDDELLTGGDDGPI
ncbi:MAG TPA: hypothetical protein VFW28_10280 [Micropepsaceae bacterium]|nr:hypothetical protein [Micropepsaceae bacterium]